MVIEKIAVRAAALTGAYGVTGHKPELVDAMAIALTRTELINQEIELFTHFCYQKEGDRFINLSGNCKLGRKVWAPWGSSGKGKLTRTERDVTRRYLLSLTRPKPLFFYQDHHWYVNTGKYKTLEWALEWGKNFSMTPTKWFEFHVG